MLKIAHDLEEKAGGALMAWWQGCGAAPVLARQADAVLLERAQGPRSLAAMATDGDDGAATRIICRVVAELHAPRPDPPPPLVPLEVWFRDLTPAARARGGLFAAADAAARALLADPRDQGVLHGDIHHGNILDFGPKGWLAIDPKGLWGERGYDYANLFRNPPTEVATRPGRFHSQVALVAHAAGLDTVRLLQWILAVMGLSACWLQPGPTRPDATLTIAALAEAALR